ncbi:MAG: lysophospholipid acyltransferase family protein [Elusimicrobiota bacterium]
MTETRDGRRAASDRMRIPHRGPIFHFFWPVTRYMVTNLTAVVAKIFFEVFNRTIVIGRENVRLDKNTVYLPNHQSMVDGFLVGYAVIFPRCLIAPSRLPWLPAAFENFYANPFVRWFSDNWNLIPVRPGRKDFRAMKRMEACLRNGLMIVFPEGTRSRTGELLPPRSGIGYVMLRTRATAVPVSMDGANRTLPVGKFWPKIFRTIYLYYGPPVDLSEFYDRPPNREIADAAIKKAFARIRRQKEVLERYRRYRIHLLAGKPFFYRIYRP